MAVIRETRAVQDFDEVVLQVVGELQIEQGDEESLVIEADESVLPHIRTEVLAGRLELGLKSWLDGVFLAGSKVIFYLKLKNVRRVMISGAGKVSAPALKAQRLELKVSGSGEHRVPSIETEELLLSISGAGVMHLAGSTGRLDITISGSGSIHARELVCGSASVHISGSGDVEMEAREALDAHISGSGSVVYTGNPPKVTQRITGSGSIRQR